MPLSYLTSFLTSFFFLFLPSSYTKSQVLGIFSVIDSASSLLVHCTFFPYLKLVTTASPPSPHTPTPPRTHTGGLACIRLSTQAHPSAVELPPLSPCSNFKGFALIHYSPFPPVTVPLLSYSFFQHFFVLAFTLFTFSRVSYFLVNPLPYFLSSFFFLIVFTS